MQKLFKDLKPDCFEDIVAAVALYRPGPLGTGMVEDFVNRRTAAPRWSTPRRPEGHPQGHLRGHRLPGAGDDDRPQDGRLLAGRRRPAAPRHGQEEARGDGQAEGHLRRRRQEAGYDEAKAVEVFDLLEYFAGYGFNKSHSAAYALITYQTAFLKRHFPAEFMAATLCSDLGKIEKLVGTINEARSWASR
jgi:DNA polymerase-3 subunit alpha